MAASSANTVMDTTATQHVEPHAARRQSRNRKDPFLELPDKQLDPIDRDENNGARPESLLVDLVLTPFYVISFILSLLVVERQQRQWRLSQHAQRPKTLWERWFTSPEPYQDSPGTTWRYHYSWKRRGVAKMQISDVLKMRGRVAVCIAVWSVICLLGSTYVLRRMYFWLF